MVAQYSLPAATGRVAENLHALVVGQPWPADYARLIEQAVRPHDPAPHLDGVSRWAALVLACASMCGAVSDAAVQAAVAATLVMAALDLFDDVEDGEPGPDADPAVLVNVATGLVLLSYHVFDTPCLRALPAPGARVLLDAALHACGGQHRDLSRHADGAEMSPEEAIAITTAKSAALVAALCRLGALAGGARGFLLARYAAFGHHLGMALQLANDLAAVQGTPSCKTDLSRRRPTLPLVYAAHGTAGSCAASLHVAPEDALMATWVVVHAYRLRARRLLTTIERTCPERGLLEPFLP